jgi:Lar family restriction alleviation protein
MQNELKPCPFCGGEAFLLQHTSSYGNLYFYVICGKCAIKTDFYKTKKAPINKWNRRVDNAE